MQLKTKAFVDSNLSLSYGIQDGYQYSSDSERIRKLSASTEAIVGGAKKWAGFICVSFYVESFAIRESPMFFVNMLNCKL